jgi:methylglyoxal synthase
MIENKRIALIAHDRRKQDMLDWVKFNAQILLNNEIVATGTTGGLIEKLLKEYWQVNDDKEDFFVDKKLSGPMGGDAEIAAMVVKKQIDFCVFFIDDLNPNPHEADIQMLLRQCRLHNIPVACNRYSADLMITSDLWSREYTPTAPKYIDFKIDL